MYVQSLTLKGCSHIYLLKVGSFSVLVENLNFKSGPTIMMCGITTSLGASPGLILSVQIIRMDFTVKPETSCVQQSNFRKKMYLHIHRILIFFFNDAEGGYLILRILTR